MKFAWDVDSSVTYAECAKLAELAQGKRVLEIGSWFGRSTIAISSTAEMVVAVDWHEGDFYAGTLETLPRFRENLDRHGATNVEVIVARIEDIWQDIAPGFGMVFIDADHSVESAQQHWEIALELVDQDGIVVFHDYGRFGVTEVVEGIGLEFETTETLAIFRLSA